MTNDPWRGKLDKVMRLEPTVRDNPTQAAKRIATAIEEIHEALEDETISALVFASMNSRGVLTIGYGGRAETAEMLACLEGLAEMSADAMREAVRRERDGET